jgi:hypothetical protein
MVAPRPTVPYIDINVYHCSLCKSASCPLTSQCHLKVPNVKLAHRPIFLTVRDTPMVALEHYWELDPGGSESAMTFDLG